MCPNGLTSIQILRMGKPPILTLTQFSTISTTTYFARSLTIAVGCYVLILRYWPIGYQYHQGYVRCLARLAFPNVRSELIAAGWCKQKPFIFHCLARWHLRYLLLRRVWTCQAYTPCCIHVQRLLFSLRTQVTCISLCDINYTSPSTGNVQSHFNATSQDKQSVRSRYP